MGNSPDSRVWVHWFLIVAPEHVAPRSHRTGEDSEYESIAAQDKHVCIGRSKAIAMFNIIIEHGTVVDGTGKPGFTGDVGIKGDRIAEIGDLSTAEAERRIDATGVTVSPGFIDIHTH